MSTERFNPPWPDAGAGHRHLEDHERINPGDEYWNSDLRRWVLVSLQAVGRKVFGSRGFVRRQCDWAKPKKSTPRISDYPIVETQTGRYVTVDFESYYRRPNTKKPMPLTAEQMKKRTAEQTEVKNRRVEEAVSALAAAWIAELELGLTVVYEGSAPMFEVSVTANRFEKPPKDLDFQEIELSAADRVIHTFMNRGFNAFRHVVGTVQHQRVTVVWDS